MSYQFLTRYALWKKRNPLNSDKYTHNKVKHPLAELILGTNGEVFLHLITYFSIEKLVSLILDKMYNEKELLLITGTKYFIFTSQTGT